MREGTSSGLKQLDRLGWFGRSLRALLSPAPLVPKRCLQASLVLGALTCFVGFLAVARLPCSIGLAVVLGAAASWSSPRLVRGYLFLVGVVLTAAVAWYPFFIAQGLAVRHESDIKSFGHSPGVLALGLAFGLRLLLDYGPVESAMRVRIAGAVGSSGLVIGSVADAAVMYLIVTRF